MKVLALIPARGGSKGLPRKNILAANGRPLIAWTIQAAIDADCIDRVVLSSDDDEICAVAGEYGCDVPFKRPSALATDEASSIDVVMHALRELRGYDYIIVLQPTSPLRTSADINAAFNLMLDSDAPACVSICLADETPYWMYRLDAAGRMQALLELPAGITRRQDLPASYSLNGAIYIAKTDWLIKRKSFISSETVGYVMPKSRSLDIDTREDFMAFVTAVID